MPGGSCAGQLSVVDLGPASAVRDPQLITDRTSWAARSSVGREVRAWAASLLPYEEAALPAASSTFLVSA
jgi:hypothetical protein